MDLDTFAKECQQQVEKHLKIGDTVEYVFNVEGSFKEDDCQLYGIGKVLSIEPYHFEVEVLEYYPQEDEISKRNMKHYHIGYEIHLPTLKSVKSEGFLNNSQEVCWNRHLVRIIKDGLG